MASVAREGGSVLARLVHRDEKLGYRFRQGESRARLSKVWLIDQVDNQADYDQIVGPGAAHIQQAMWTGMLAAVEKVWGATDRVIMCMSHNERMLNGPGGLGVDRPQGDLVFRYLAPIGPRLMLNIQKFG